METDGPKIFKKEFLDKFWVIFKNRNNVFKIIKVKTTEIRMSDKKNEKFLVWYKLDDGTCKKGYSSSISAIIFPGNKFQ